MFSSSVRTVLGTATALALGALGLAACAAGAEDTEAASLGFTASCSDGGTTTALGVSLTAPTASASVSGIVTLAAHGTGNVKNMEFFELGGALIGRATLVGADGTFAWDTRGHASGVAVVYATVWDVAAGVTPFNDATSTPVSFNIQNGAAAGCGAVPDGALDITAYGAVSSATTDNQAAIQKALDAAKAAKKAVYVPPGTFAHRGTLILDGVALWGAGDASVLPALDVTNEALVLRSSGAGVHSVKLTSNATSRLSTPGSAMMWADHATSFDVSCVSVDGSSSVGIISIGASNGAIHDNNIKNTLADSIHMTDATNNMSVFKNRIENSGDDGVACVSYAGVAPGDGPDSAYVRDVKAWDNVILTNKGGRAMSVVGGKRIEYWNNYLRGGTGSVQTACIYLAQEGSYGTWEANTVYIHDNQVVACGGSVHPASLLVYADQWANRDIRIENNSFWQNRGGQGAIALQGTSINVTQTGTKIDVGAVPSPP